MTGRLILNKEQLEDIAKRLGEQISNDLKGSKRLPVIVGVMKGSLNFMMDLLKYVDIPVYTDYIQISSYSGTTSSGVIKLVKDLSYDCIGRTVVIVEDIVDTGNSMSYLIKHVASHNPDKILVCTLFDKKTARKTDVKCDYVGKEIDGDDFLIGYGLDFNEIGRNIPYVYGASKEDIEELKNIYENDKN